MKHFTNAVKMHVRHHLCKSSYLLMLSTLLLLLLLTLLLLSTSSSSSSKLSMLADKLESFRPLELFSWFFELFSIFFETKISRHNSWASLSPPPVAIGPSAKKNQNYNIRRLIGSLWADIKVKIDLYLWKHCISLVLGQKWRQLCKHLSPQLWQIWRQREYGWTPLKGFCALLFREEDYIWPYLLQQTRIGSSTFAF